LNKLFIALYQAKSSIQSTSGLATERRNEIFALNLHTKGKDQLEEGIKENQLKENQLKGESIKGMKWFGVLPKHAAQ